MPRDEKPRRGNNNDDDDDDDDAAVPITSVLSLFFAFGNLTVLHRCSSILYMTKKKKNKNVCIFESALPFKLTKRVYDPSHFYLETRTNL